MPSAGLQMFGAGLQLQPVTPGVKNIGNANVSGTLLASTFGNNQFPNDGTLLLGKRISLNSNYTGPISSTGNNIIVGQGLDLTGGTSTNNTQDCVFIGSAWLFVPGSGLGMQQSVVIGTTAQVSSTILPQHVTLLGCNATGSGGDITNGTGIGGSAYVGVNDCVAVGYQAKVKASRGVAIGSGAQVTGSGDGICIGYGTRDNGNPSIIAIGAGIAPPASTRSFAVIIGASNQMDVQIGPYRLGVSTGVTTKVNDANYNAVSADGIIMYSTLTAARTVNLQVASMVPAGYIVRVVDGSGAASGANSITTVPSGTDTIVGPGVPAITTAYGSDRFMSDGVSKWICCNNL